MQTLTERDSEVLMSVYTYRYLTTAQIERLHFPSRRTAQRRLSRLAGSGLLTYFTVPAIADRIYMLTRRGASHIARSMSIAPDELLWSKRSGPPKDYYFMKHFVGISDFRISLTRATEHSMISLLGFIPEHYGTKHASGRITKYIKDVSFSTREPGERILHTPDAVFALESKGKALLFFLEIDRGTETISNPNKGVGKMVRFYEAYANEGRYRGYAQDFGCAAFGNFRLLIVTTTQRRIGNMRNALGDARNPVHKFFWLTTSDKVTEASILERQWVSLDGSDEAAYGIA